jgi:hypothetical protein
MIDIKIDDNYKITSDEMQFVLQKKNVVKDDGKGKKPKIINIGKEVWYTIGYYRDIKSVLKAYVKENVLRSDCKTFEEVFELLDELYEVIDGIVDVE